VKLEDNVGQMNQADNLTPAQADHPRAAREKRRARYLERTCYLSLPEAFFNCSTVAESIQRFDCCALCTTSQLLSYCPF
jgi:hypothetical protein